MNDLYLKYHFTDRAGRHVYIILAGGDHPPILGQIRLHPDKDDNVLLEWAEETQDED